jgi:hypothetical protein
MVWLNSQAFAVAGIPEDTPNPPEGELLRDPDGRFAGCAGDAAGDLIESLKELYRSGLFKLRFSGALVNALGNHRDPGMVEYLACCPEYRTL